jgi:hypothetical protein
MDAGTTGNFEVVVDGELVHSKKTNAEHGFLHENKKQQAVVFDCIRKVLSKSVDEAPNKKTKVENSGSSAADACDVHKQLLAAGPDGDSVATDEQLAAAMECERSVYVSGDDAVRKAFAPASIAKWTSSTYEGSDRTKYHEGTLKEGDQAPDFDLHQLEAPNQPLKSCKLLSFLPKDKKYLVLNFGSFS